MKRTVRWGLALLAVFALFAASCSDDKKDEVGTSGSTTGGATDAPVTEGPAIKIGAQDFGESAILAQIYGQALADAGYTVEYQELGGFRDIEFQAFANGEINFSAEYVATTLEYLNENANQATNDVDATLALLQPKLAETGLVALEPAPGVNTNAFVITKETSDRLGIKTLSDLAAKGADLKLGGPADCPKNDACIPGLKETYDLDLSGNFVALDPGVVATSLQNDEIDVGVLFSTDGVLTDENLVLLEDDKGLFNADNIVPITTQTIVGAYGDAFTTLVNGISAKLTTEELVTLNEQFSVEKLDAADIAKEWLQSNGIL